MRHEVRKDLIPEFPRRSHLVGAVQDDDDVLVRELCYETGEAVQVVLAFRVLGVEDANENIRKTENAVQNAGIGRTLRAVGVRRVHENRSGELCFGNGQDFKFTWTESPHDCFGVGNASHDGGRLAGRRAGRAGEHGVFPSAKGVHERRFSGSRSADKGDHCLGLRFCGQGVDVAQRFFNCGCKVRSSEPVGAGGQFGFELRQAAPLLRKAGATEKI